MPSKSEGDGNLARGQESGDKKVEKVISVGFWWRDFVDLSINGGFCTETEVRMLFSQIIMIIFSGKTKSPIIWSPCI